MIGLLACRAALRPAQSWAWAMRRRKRRATVGKSAGEIAPAAAIASIHRDRQEGSR
jgi:hypothetical protein